MEHGILDLIEMLNSEMTAITARTQAITRAMEDYSTQLKVRTDALKALSPRRPQQMLVRARQISNLAAGDVNELAETLESEVPALRGHLEQAPILLTKLAPTIRENAALASQLRPPIVNFYEQMGTSTSNTETLLATMRDMPGMTGPLISARDRVVVIVEELVETLRSGRQAFEEAAALLSD